MPSIQRSLLANKQSQSNSSPYFNPSNLESQFYKNKSDFSHWLESIIVSFKKGSYSRSFFKDIDALAYWLYEELSKASLFDTVEKKLASQYLRLVQFLCTGDNRRSLENASEKLQIRHLRKIAALMVDKSNVTDNQFMKDYFLTLEYALSVKRFLKEYNENTLSITSLSRKYFLKAESRWMTLEVVAQSFKILGFEGKLFFQYFESSSDILFRNQGTKMIVNEAMDLQKYFLMHIIEKSKNVDQSLLKFYFCDRFFKKGIYKHNPDTFATINQDKRFIDYIDCNYELKPKEFLCELDSNLKVTMKYDNDISENIPLKACEYAKFSAKQYSGWVESFLGPKISSVVNSLAGNCTLTFSKNPEQYKEDLFNKGVVPLENDIGRYHRLYRESRPLPVSQLSQKEKVVSGLAFALWQEQGQGLITVAHEIVHHLNHRLEVAVSLIRGDYSAQFSRNQNEGLASFFSEGVCSPSYAYLKIKDEDLPTLSYFLGDIYAGYPRSWLYNNYILEVHKDFYADFLTKSKGEVLKKWEPILFSREHFQKWFELYNQICSDYRAKKLSMEGFFSIHLQDYEQALRNVSPDTSVTSSKLPFTSTLNPLLISRKRYSELMYALGDKDFSQINVLINLNCLNTAVINYNQENITLLNYAIVMTSASNRYCSTSIIQKFIQCGADPNITDKQNRNSYDFNNDYCVNSQEIKNILDSASPNTRLGIRPARLPLTTVANLPVQQKHQTPSTTSRTRSARLPSTKGIGLPTQEKQPGLQASSTTSRIRPARSSSTKVVDLPSQEKRPVSRPTRASNIPQIQQTKEYYDLMRALGSQDPSNVKKFIQPICLNTSMINYVNPGLRGQTPLHYALAFNKNGYCSPLIMQQLVDCGANPKISDQSNQTAYHFAMQHCQNWPQIKTIFDPPLLESSTTTRLPVVETTKKIADNSSLRPVDVETTSEVTDIVPYRPRHYEYVVINVSTSVAKGSFTALSRYGFEKWQKHSSFAGRHPLLISVVKPIGDAVVISAMNLIYFSKKNGMIFNLSEMASGCIYFSVDLGLMFGTGLINNKVQALLKPRIERGSWLQKIPLNTGYFLFITAMFFLNNCSAIFGENAKGHELEVFLRVLANALLSSLVHHGVYNSINFLENYCGSVSQQENFDSEANPELESFICESVPCSNEHFISRQKTVDSKNIQSECSETSLMLGPDSSEIIPEEMLNIEILIDNLDKKIKSEKLKKSQLLFDQVDVLKLWAKNKYKEKSRFKEYKKNVKKLKITVPESSKECIEILREIYKNLSSQSIKKQCSDHKLQRIQYFVELLEQRLSFTDLSISEQETKINYLDNIKHTLRDKIESVQSLVSSTIEKINSGKNNSEGVIEFCKKLNSLERSLLDMELMAHVYGYYEYYSRADIKKILPYLNKGSDLDRGATDIENLYKDLEEKLDLVYSNLDNCKKSCEGLTTLDKKAYQEMIDTSQQSIADLLREIDQEKKKVVQSKRPKKWLDFGLFSPKQARNKAAVDKNRSVPLHCINPRC